LVKCSRQGGIPESPGLYRVGQGTQKRNKKSAIAERLYADVKPDQIIIIIIKYRRRVCKT
jgi:hypothetical protein